jgi:hypothetical protein
VGPSRVAFEPARGSCCVDYSAQHAVSNDHNTKTNTARGVHTLDDIVTKVLLGTRLSEASCPSVRSVDLYLKDSDDANVTR